MLTILKPPSTQTENDYIYPGDDALDHKAEDWETELEAALESASWDRLPLKPNAKPTVFTLRQPTGELKRLIQGIAEQVGAHTLGSTQAWREIASLCLVKVVDFGCPPFGASHEFETVLNPKHGFRVVRAKEMDLLEQVDGGGLIDGLGLHVFMRLNPSKNS